MQHEGCASFQDALHDMPLQASEIKHITLLGSTCQVTQDVHMSEGLVVVLHW